MRNTVRETDLLKNDFDMFITVCHDTSFYYFLLLFITLKCTYVTSVHKTAYTEKSFECFH